MKRVHNDHGSSSGGSPPAALPVAQPASKGRKRKTEGSDAQTTASRKASQKSATPKDTKLSTTKPLLDQWMDHRNAVEELLRGLNKPEDARNIQQISEMQARLVAMTKVTTDLNTVQSSDVPHLAYMATG